MIITFITYAFVYTALLFTLGLLVYVARLLIDDFNDPSLWDEED